MDEHKNILVYEEKPLKAVYFLGIGGIGMSALARYYNSKGVKVSGYDKTPTPLTNLLKEEGIEVHFEDKTELLDRNANFVVYTPAIPKDHKELNYFKENGYSLRKRSEVLGSITKGNFNICVAGTHGKTTTSAMIAHLLRDTGYGCNAFLGGIAANYNTNFWSSEKNVCVAEADEYDRSFLQLSPDVVIITAMDADHLDIYGDEKSMQDAFIQFTGKAKPGGLLISKKGIVRSDEFTVGNKWTYSATDATADFHSGNIRIVNGSYVFDLVVRNRVIKDVELNMGGMHNVENAIAAIAVAVHLNIDEEKIKQAVANFAGVRRRFEYIVKNNERVVIDDYAHHPEELRALIKSAKDLFPTKRCSVIFQPHLFSRTNDLADGFAEVLSIADEVILLPIYPARELPMPGVTSQLILNKMTNPNGSLKEKEELLGWLKENDTELLIISGAGDVDAMVEPIRNIVIKK
ncbi:MAG: UDP-N-acetylmuramate--L-alanine ligase [Chitinophagaceae bacterium]|nr:MAG: UDP-N-acetylmuramate--L-alanine ligase [Chitinophagaceae bacterium]